VNKMKLYNKYQSVLTKLAEQSKMGLNTTDLLILKKYFDEGLNQLHTRDFIISLDIPTATTEPHFDESRIYSLNLEEVESEPTVLKDNFGDFP